MHTYFGNRFIGIGEDHKGAHAFSFDNESHVENLKNLLKNKNQIICWYEGPKANHPSPSFTNFVKQLKSWLKNNREYQKVRVIEKGWELSLKFKRNEEMTGILLGAEAGEYAKLLKGQLNRKQTLAEAIVKAKTIKGSQGSPVTMSELIRCLTDQKGPTDVLETMQRPNSAAVETLYEIYSGGYGAMRAKYFAGTKNAKKNSSVYKRVDNFNKARDIHLGKLMKSRGGIFLAGDGHIETIRKYV